MSNSSSGRGLTREQRAALSRFLNPSAAAEGGEVGAPRIRPDPSARFEPFPLTDMQEAFWVGRGGGLDLGNVACHIYYEMEAEGLSLERFRAAWQRLVARHDALRAVITPDGRQRVLEEVPAFEIPFERVGAAGARRLEEVREEMSHRLRPADRWPLFEVRVSQLDGGRARLHFSFDTLICDGQSVQILIRELARLCRDPAAELPPLELSLRDYQLYVRSLEGSERHRRAAAYWRRRLGELAPAPELPLAVSPAAVRRPRFVRRQAGLDAPLWERLKGRAARVGVTPAGLLIAAFADVLAAWGAGERFTLNLTLFDRLPVHPQVNDILGDFTSSCLFVVEAAHGDSFEEMARALQKRLWEDLDHSEVSGVRVTRELARERGETPRAMPVVFTSHLNESPEPLPWPVVYGVSQTPQVWLDHQALERGGRLVYHWDAVEALFPGGLLDAMFEAYGEELRALAEGEQAWRRALRGASTRADELASQANRTDGPVAAETLPVWGATDAEACECAAVIGIGPSARLTYARLRRLARRVTAEVSRRRLGPEAPVAVVMEKGWEQAVAVIGILEAGAAYVPLEAAWPTERVAGVIEEARVRLVFTQRRLLGRHALPHGVEVVCVPDEDSESEDDGSRVDPLPRAAGGDGLAYVIYTSGSTGRPKGVMIEHRAAVNTVLDINERFSVGASDRLLSLSSLSFDLSVYDLFGALAAGAAVVLPEASQEKDPRHWVELMERERVTVWNTVPALMEMLVEYLEGSGRAAPAGLRLVLLSGDWIPVSLPERVRRLWPAAEVVSLGGATEASIWSVFYPVGEVDPNWASIPYGTPLRNQRVYVRDARLRECPVWATGELCIGGVGVARGYFGDEERTRERFVDDPLGGGRLYRTGDLGRRRPDGVVEILGRADRQIKLHGYRIEPGEVEAALARHPRVASAAVTSDGRRLLAFVVARAPSEPPGGAELRAFLSGILPVYMIPATFVPLDKLPLTANGKVDRGALPRHAPSVPAAAPRTEAQTKLAALWSQVLGVAAPGVHDDFFRAGGDSIRAIRLYNLIRETFGYELPLQTLFATPTIAQVAEAIEGGAAATEPLPLVAPGAAQGDEPFPLTDIQQAYWVGRREGFELGNVAPHVYAEFESSTLDVGRLESAWQRLIERHGMLRAVFTAEGEQRVLASVPPYRFRTHDLRGLPPEERARRLAEVRGRMSHQVHDPARWPLFEVAVSELDDRVRLHFSFDLLIGDAWSLVILTRELARFYFDPEWRAAPLALSFGDYVLAEKGLQGGERFRRSWDYWQSRLRDLPGPPALPVAPRPDASERPRFTRRSGSLTAEQWRRIQERGAQEGLTPSAVLASAYAGVLAAWGAGERFTLNLTLFNRLPVHPQVNDILGDFTSLTLLEVDLAGEESFVGRTRRLQRQLWRDLDHRFVSGVRVLRELAKLGKGGVPVVFTSTLGFEEESSSFEELPVEPVYGVSQTPQVWLDHQALERGGRLVYHWDAVEALFPGGLLDAMFEAYGEELRALAEGEQAWRRALRGAQARAEAPASHAGDAGEIIRLRGYLIEPGEVEAALARHPRVASAAVTSDGRRLLAFVVPSRMTAGKIEDLAFRLGRRGLREGADADAVELLGEPAESLRERWMARRSARSFLSEPVPFAQFSRLLSCLRSLELPDQPFPKYMYGSAGGLYPVQVYLLVRPGRVEGVRPGAFYYHPQLHRLLRLDELPGDTPVEEGDPAFFILLVAKGGAIEPIYGPLAPDFCKLEAGIMSHLLEVSAAEAGLGLCQLGGFPFDAVRGLLKLEDDHLFLHGLWGGLPAPEAGGAHGLDADALADFARAHLPAHMVPDCYVELAALPLDPSGCVNRAELALMGARAYAEPRTSAAPETEEERAVAEIWGRLLGRSDLSVEESFYEAGGDSILLVRLQNELTRRFGRAVPLGELLDNPTVRSLAARLSNQAEDGAVKRGKSRAELRRQRLR